MALAPGQIFRKNTSGKSKTMLVCFPGGESGGGGGNAVLGRASAPRLAKNLENSRFSQKKGFFRPITL
jgi:hypothetical protein